MPLHLVASSTLDSAGIASFGTFSLACAVWCATHRRALPEQARLLHTSGPPKLLHVLAEVTLAALAAGARLAAAAPRPPAPRPTAQRLTARHPTTSQL